MGRLLVLIGVLGVSLSLPPAASAHPLGNFTINHFSHITIGTDDVRIAHVLDMAEIPAVSERQRIDTDDDEALSDAEIDAWLAIVVPELLAGLTLEIDGEPMALIPASDARLTFPDGQAGLPTLRLELDLVAHRPASDRVSGIFRNAGFADRIGWREIIVDGAPGVAVTDSSVPAASVSDALRAYPEAALDDPIDVREARFSVRLDASAAAPPGSPPAGPAAPGDAQSDPLARLLSDGSASTSAALLAILVSLGLGALHAASPGHGKTLVAAYLIGARGTPSHALTLGLTVALTHTLGVFVLGGIVLGASELLVPDRVVEWLSLVAGVIVIGMGLALVIGAARTRLLAREHLHGHQHGEGQGHAHDHDHGHTHAPAPLSRRSVAIIGLAGGLVPSASALIVLLVAVSQGQLALGVVLIASFGVGMALVLGGIGLAVVLARRRVEDGGFGFLAHPRLVRVGRALPVVSAMAVLVIGIVLTAAAVGRIA